MISYGDRDTFSGRLLQASQWYKTEMKDIG